MTNDMNKDDMDKDDKIRSANHRLDKVDATLSGLVAPMEALFAAPPMPRAPMLAIVRLLAEDAGCPARCASARCRRAGRCRAEHQPTENPPCAAQWDAAHSARLDGALLGLAAAWADETRRMKALRERLAASAPAIRGDGRKRAVRR